ncbi:putative O-glycosylation ligase, exosortase A system-associated [Ferrovum myxofaciens]|uniref:putative O-glycosylation ligase, exosortase A system-associated n=1 Tax=Ferrovum myxofaciens TaxID=416213 RepID=UPI00054EE399|nr:putative O-glycosylation ligase, exosortase A system-associated [Ferrovum myxofaciens]
MRDILITLIVLWILFKAVKHPAVGILGWVWISVMNPHRLAWGFAYDFPFAMLMAAVTLLSLVITKDKRQFPVTPATVSLILFIFWMNITSLFAINFDQIYPLWSRVMKILFMTLVAMSVLNTKQHIRWLVWTLVVSLGYYGVKGGAFTLATGGGYTVWGPAGSFIEENNALAVATIMLIPMLRYLQLTEENLWVRRGLVVAMGLCAVSAIGSYSRGALIAIVSMSFFLWTKSPRKLPLALLMIILIPFVVLFMPQKWEDRMNTIQTYQQDSSALGRLNAWGMAWNLAVDRPLVGGGFEIYDKEVFARYAPEPKNVHAAHSIYFQILGEHGFVGLFLFLAIGFFTWRSGSWIIRETRGKPDLHWANTLARMLQVSQIAYATGAAFLSLAYFDLPYYIVVLMEVTKLYIKNQQEENSRVVSSQRPGPQVIRPAELSVIPREGESLG